ncbi:MAG TPA: DUF4350 domain-containing protein [Pirellulales bacterium]|nr:DUF4350 domain-containing protein [Pirellulales bacterium]
MSKIIVWPLVALAALTLAGCEDGIETTYGRRWGIDAGDSVNGTAVLARMFESAGHHVTTATRLSPRVYETADCIVWAPDDFKPPSEAVRQWFDAWWRHGSNRTLVYIGRDYDAAPSYWRAVQAAATPAQRAEMMRRLARDQNEYLTARGEMPNDEDCEWFVAQGTRKQRAVTTLQGADHWTEGVDASKIEVELNGRLVPPHDAEVLLESQGDAIVSSQEADNDGRLIVVVNGSFVVNFPLVNHENRKLAARLIEEVGEAPQEVVFLESGSGGPPIWEDEPPERARTALEILAIWPFNAIFLQLGALGLIFCYSRLPIFGRPRPLTPPGLADFGRHVAALGTLLARTQDRVYAAQRVAHYQQTVRREPGRFRRSASQTVPTPADPQSTQHPTSPTPRDE